MPDSSFVTKDEQAAKIFRWAAGAAACAWRTTASSSGPVRKITAKRTAYARRTARTGSTTLCPCLGADRCRGRTLEYDAGTQRLTMAPFMEALLLDDTDFQYSAGLVTNHAVESRLADRVEDCFTEGRWHPLRRLWARDGRDHSLLQQGGVRAVPARVLLPAMPELKERLTAGGTILELGCGAGAGLVSLARTFPACTVTGSTPTRLDRAGKQRIEAAGFSEHVHAEEMRGEDLTSEDAFDFIYTQISLHEMDDARIVLANARRALKDDGVLLITEIRGPERSRTPSAITTRCSRTSTCSTRSRRRSRRAATPPASSRSAEFEAMATESGLRDIRELHLEQPLYAAFVARK